MTIGYLAIIIEECRVISLRYKITMRPEMIQEKRSTNRSTDNKCVQTMKKRSRFLRAAEIYIQSTDWSKVTWIIDAGQWIVRFFTWWTPRWKCPMISCQVKVMSWLYRGQKNIVLSYLWKNEIFNLLHCFGDTTMHFCRHARLAGR